MEFVAELTQEIVREWPIVAAAPFLSISILAVGLIFGWSSAWLILRQRLTHHKEVIEQYEKANEKKGVPRPKQKEPLKSFSIPLRSMLYGIIAIVCVVTIPLYFAITSLAPSYGPSSRLLFSPANFFHTPEDQQSLHFNVQFTNTGESVARKLVVTLSGFVRSEPMAPDEVENLLATLHAGAVNYGGISQDEIQAGSGQIVTVPNISMTNEQLQQFSQGKTFLYVLYTLQWEDNSLKGREYWSQDFCGFFEGVLTYFHGCSGNIVERLPNPRH